MINRVLVIADQEIDRNIALQKASEFIGSSVSSVDVLAFIETDRVHAAVPSQKERLAVLEQACAHYLRGNYQISLDIIATPDIASYCAEYCREHTIDVVIKAAHRSKKHFYTPLDWRLIKTSPCPVIIAVEHELSATRKLLVALDTQSKNSAQQDLDKKVLEWAGQWSTSQKYSLHVACCIEALDPTTNADVDLLIDLENKLRPRLEPKVQELLDDLGLKAKGILIGAGTTGVVLSRLAEELHADLVVMGYSSRQGLAELLLGHTAERVMKRLKTNLAVVPDRSH